ncbi:MAG TPA: polysaccharide deacetylase family protein [Terriglobales bacterium]|nr:polysaccharide deacetylase family protein [Terriglobales bacterium]
MLGLAIGATVAASAGGIYSYGAMAPQSQLFGATVHDGSDPRQIALTYDDGPNDPHTLRLLDVLAKHNVKATFFLIGRFVAQRPDIAQRIAAAGHAIGNHTYTHPKLVFTSQANLKQELTRCEQALRDAVGDHSNLFRPPFGGRRPDVLRTIRAQGLVPVMWSVTCFDWKETTTDRVMAHATRQIAAQTARGKIVLLHDGGYRAMGTDRAHTVEATDRLLARYKGKYQFVTVPEMVTA